MKILSFTVALLATALFASDGMSQSKPETIELWPAGKIPYAIANSAVQEKADPGNDGIARISNVTVPTLAVYLPPKEKATGVGVMVCPGGGYRILAIGHEGEDIARWLNEQGIAAFVLKYRLPDDRTSSQKNLVPLSDAMRGMQLIRQNAQKWGLKANKVGVMGFSAGGHLASTLSTHFDKPNEGAGVQPDVARPDFSILMYPVISFGQFAHSGSRESLIGKNASQEQIDLYSNEKQVTAKTPPTFLVHALDDKAVPVENSIQYYLALKAAGVPAEMHLYPTGGHGFALRTQGKGTLEGWPEALKGWLKGMSK
ncbi:alpha/beta hydrolase [Tellurirhabdus rosea]|uniref:alpha/beta hydrolase n=1 Tax=Tellurirhabdus rosea TaxID=2674997 RepID=UPI00224DA2D0|nr:alpha/beta hydrolase [Tellurirhabdus rosea]